MKTLLNLAVAGLLLLVCVSASADIPVYPVNEVVVVDDSGGVIVEYIRKYSNMRDAGTKLVVAGDCASACTLFLGLLSPSKYCMLPTARLGFHTASLRTIEHGMVKFEHAPEFSELMFSLYPSKVRRLVKRLGWDGDKPEIAHPEIIWVEGDDLAKVAPMCRQDAP